MNTKMIPKFAESYFVVTFQGEAPQSTLVKGWAATLAHICGEEGLGVIDQDERDGYLSTLNDPDFWTTLSGMYKDNDDERHVFGPEEVAESVYVMVTRITEPTA